MPQYQNKANHNLYRIKPTTIDFVYPIKPKCLSILYDLIPCGYLSSRLTKRVSIGSDYIEKKHLVKAIKFFLLNIYHIGHICPSNWTS